MNSRRARTYPLLPLLLLALLATRTLSAQRLPFLKALGRVNQWKIAGQQLELFDAAGTMLARFEAVYMR